MAAGVRRRLPPAAPPIRRRLRCLKASQALSVLPDTTSRALDCVLLTNIVTNALQQPPGTTGFTEDNLVLLRRWAKGRHVYGTRYGFPGGSAWMVMPHGPAKLRDRGVCSCCTVGGSTTPCLVEGVVAREEGGAPPTPCGASC